MSKFKPKMPGRPSYRPKVKTILEQAAADHNKTLEYTLEERTITLDDGTKKVFKVKVYKD